MNDAHVAERAVDEWERRTEWPLAAGAVLFLLAYSWPILDVHVSPGWRTACQVSGYAIWAIFAIDYATRIGLAKRRRRYVVRHVPDLLVVALPILRPLRLLRLVMLLRMLNRGATDSLRGRVAIYVAGAAVLLIYTASLAELDAERHAPHSNITGFGDAVWWAMTTVTTVGYGDRYPVTAQGRLVAAGLHRPHRRHHRSTGLVADRTRAHRRAGCAGSNTKRHRRTVPAPRGGRRRTSPAGGEQTSHRSGRRRAGLAKATVPAPSCRRRAGCCRRQHPAGDTTTRWRRTPVRSGSR